MNIEFVDAKVTILIRTIKEFVNKLERFGSVMFFERTNEYLLIVDEAFSKEEVMNYIDFLNYGKEKIVKPQMKRRIAPYNIFQDEQFCFYSSMEDAELLTEFGTVDKLSIADDKYAFLLNKQYDLQDVLDYIKALNSES